MDIVIQQKGDMAIVELSGKLDTITFSELENAFSKLFNDQVWNILLDCQKLDYISSSGLRVLLVALKKVDEAKGKFYLCNLQPRIHNIFEISGFENIFKIYNSIDEARKYF